MKVFTITKEGAYRHEILGIYSNLSCAMETAFKHASAEKEDGYHSYLVGETELGLDCEDVTPLYDYQKGDYYSGNFGKVKIQRCVNGDWEDCV